MSLTGGKLDHGTWRSNKGWEAITTEKDDPIQLLSDWWVWDNLRRGAERDDFHATIWDKEWFQRCDLEQGTGLYQATDLEQNYSGKGASGTRRCEVTLWQRCWNPADRWHSLPVSQREYCFRLIMARSGSVDVCGSPWDRCKNCGWSRWSDKPWRMILEYKTWTIEYLRSNYTVSILNYLKIGHQIGLVLYGFRIYRWWGHWIMLNMLVEGPWKMS